MQNILVESYDDRTIRAMDQRQHNIHHADGDYDGDGCWDTSDWDNANYTDGDWNDDPWHDQSWDEGDYYQSDYNHDDWNDDDWANFEEEEDDGFYLESDDSVAYVDDYGFFWATEEVIDHVDAQDSTGSTEYAQAIRDFATARAALSKARIARGFFPVVIPSDAVYRAKGKSKGGRRGKGKRKGKATGKSRGKSKGTGSRRGKG